MARNMVCFFHNFQAGTYEYGGASERSACNQVGHGTAMTST